MMLRNGTVMSARSIVRPFERHLPGRQQVLPGEQLAGLHERRAGERDVVAGPLRHHLVGGDEVVVPQVLPQVDVAGDVAERLEHAERVEHHVGGHVAGGVEHVGRLDAALLHHRRHRAHVGEVDRRRHHGQAAHRQVGVAGDGQQRQQPAEAVAEHVDVGAAGDLGDLAR